MDNNTQLTSQAYCKTSHKVLTIAASRAPIEQCPALAAIGQYSHVNKGMCVLILRVYCLTSFGIHHDMH